MALRSAFARLFGGPQAMQATTLRHFSIPTVYDSMVQFQVMDPKGNRHTLRGLEGQRLIDVLVDNMNELDLDDSICKNPARACDYEAHVKLPKELLQYVPAPEGYDQVELFRAWADNRDDNSRPASSVVLNKEMNGTLFAIGDVYPFRTF